MARKISAQEKCIRTLRRLVRQGNASAIALAGLAIDEYTAAYPVERRAAALKALELRVAELVAKSTGASEIFAEAICDQLERRIEILDWRPAQFGERN